MSDNARPRLSAALAAWTRSAAAEVVVARSVEVVDVDADGAVSVRMLTPIQEVVAGTPRWVDAPILPRIPVAYMSIGDLTITAAPSIGDRGLVLVRDVDHGQVDERQGDPTVSPEDPRRWDPRGRGLSPGSPHGFRVGHLEDTRHRWRRGPGRRDGPACG